ncbi:MAG: RsmD family RNA methyltransferase [Candidatus Riflebacteria bacterium]|nr:RsmD family RNA methyltransferase [Candidatus Riflebacteria bacterium]
MSAAKLQSVIAVVEGLTCNGEAFVSIDNVMVRVPGLLPGDKIELKLHENGKVADAQMLEPSPERVKPDCFFHGPCGGCDLLELSEKGRKKEKQAMIARTLNRIPGGNDAYLHSFQASREIIRYLPRVRLHQSRNYDARESGYLASENYSQTPGGVVPVTACAIITQALSRRLVAARKILNQLPVFLDNLTLMSSSSQRSDRVVGHAVLMKGRPVGHHHDDLTKIMRAANLKGLSVANNEGKIKEVLGSVSVTGLIAPEVAGGPYDAEPSFFVQGNIFQNQVLIRKIIELCKPATGIRIVEGFAGAGNFTLALAAKGAQVDAIESHPGAIRTGVKNIKRSGFEEKITLVEGDAIKELSKFKPEPDVLLLDPPRTGTPSIGRTIAKLLPKKIVCVFCDLEACERDSIAIIRSGYKLTEAAGLDLYPRTHHVELVCLFERA